MNLTKLSIKRPVSVFIIVLALAVFGFSAIFSAPMELLPDMEMPMMIIMTTYPGAGPEDVEDQVTKTIENATATLNGVKTVQSQSSENMSMVMLEMEYGTDMDTAHMDLQKNLDMYASTLPDTVSDPVILEMSMDMMATITLSAKATGDLDLLNYLEENIVPEFEKLGGVASVEVSGGEENYVSVRLKEERMRQYGLDISSVASYIGAADFSMPAGSIDRGSQSLTLRGGVSYDTIESLKNIPLMTSSGNVIHLSDVADVYAAVKDSDSISRYNGQDNVTLSVTKRQSASTLDVTKAVTQTMERLNAQNEGVELSVINDSSEQILSSLQTVFSTLVMGVLLSMVVLFLFFGDWKASVIVGSSMPISVLTTLVLMNATGITLNIISLGGLVIGVGMMVDNSIVVLESCFRVREQRMDYREAAVEGARLVTSSIIASTLTTIVVFLPISLMSGLSGQMFKQLGFTIIFSLTASLISALTLVPLLFLRVKPRERTEIPLSRLLRRVEAAYGRFLKKTFRVKWLVVLTSVVLLVASFGMLGFINMELIPSIDQGVIAIEVNTRPGLQTEKLDSILQEIEQTVVACDDLDSYYLTGSSGGGSLTVYLKAERSRDTDEWVDEWRGIYADVVGYEVDISAQSMSDMISGGGSVQVNLQGNDRDTLEEASKQVAQLMRQHEGIIRATSSLTDGNPQAEIEIDPIRANAVGLMPAQVMSSVSAMMNGTDAATIRQDGQEYDITVEYPSDLFKTVSDLSGMTLVSPTGREVPLLDIASISYSNSPQTITRQNNQYIVTITGQTTTAARLTAPNEIYAQVAQMELPEGVEMAVGASTEQMMEEFTALLGAIAAAIFLVFMVMAMQFESVRFSLIVMICIPFSLIGSMLLLLVSRVTLSMPSMMGFLMLVGIVINNGILFIDTANRMRASMDAETALIYAGRTRMRPILMTTLTTILSMIPMGLGIGDGSELMQGMAIVIIGGLTASTILTLLLLPTFYLLFSGKKNWGKTPGPEPEEQLPPPPTSDSEEDEGDQGQGAYGLEYQ